MDGLNQHDELRMLSRKSRCSHDPSLPHLVNGVIFLSSEDVILPPRGSSPILSYIQTVFITALTSTSPIPMGSFRCSPSLPSAYLCPSRPPQLNLEMTFFRLNFSEDVDIRTNHAELLRSFGIHESSII